MFPDQPYLTLLYRALFSTAYFGLFRIGELTKGMHPVLAKDVHIADNKRKMLFILHTSKMHWTDVKPQIIKIMSKGIALVEKESNYCPYRILQQYLAVRECSFIQRDEPFFVFCDRSPVTADNMRNTLKKTLLKAGFDADFYNSRSFRSGRAGDLQDLGLSLESVKKIGRWKSNSVFTYLRN